MCSGNAGHDVAEEGSPPQSPAIDHQNLALARLAQQVAHHTQSTVVAYGADGACKGTAPAEADEGEFASLRFSAGIADVARLVGGHIW